MDCLKKILPGFAIVTQPKVKTPFENRINLMVPILKNKNSVIEFVFSFKKMPLQI